MAAPYGHAVALDIETTGLEWSDRVLAVSAAWRDESGKVVSEAINTGLHDLFTHPVTTVELHRWLQAVTHGASWIVFHNGSFDVPYLLRSGAMAPEDFKGRIFDTMLMARCTAARESVSLANLVADYGLMKLDGPQLEFYSRMKSLRSSLSRADPQDVLRYACMDTENTLRLFEKLMAEAREQYDEAWIRREGDFVLEVAKMRHRGIQLNIPRIHELIEERRARLPGINRVLLGAGVRGPTDNQGMLRSVRMAGGEHLLGKTDKGKPALDEEALVRVRQEIPGIEKTVSSFLEGRRITKQLSTWLEGFLAYADRSGRIHPLFNAGGTVSFRLSCTKPNAQAVAADLVADVFGARSGYDFVEADASQAELRLVAAYAQEDKLAEIFHQGIDTHYGTAVLMFGEAEAKARRQDAKRAAFTSVYGGGAAALAENLRVDMETARRTISRYRDTFPGIRQASKQAEQVWCERGYLVLAHGKRLYASRDDIERRPYKAFNQLIQASVAEIFKVAMLRLAEELPEAPVVAQIHDSLAFEVEQGPHQQEIKQQAMQIISESAPAELMSRTKPPVVFKIDVKGGKE